MYIVRSSEACYVHSGGVQECTTYRVRRSWKRFVNSECRAELCTECGVKGYATYVVRSSRVYFVASTGFRGAICT